MATINKGFRDLPGYQSSSGSDFDTKLNQKYAISQQKANTGTLNAQANLARVGSTNQIANRRIDADTDIAKLSAKNAADKALTQGRQQTVPWIII
ncbi:MAG: hypothetical protein KZQ83_13310 [gamma proteobacterium symbiont of Taylorina sp.]|nr:hypothetical protein [gamma proteobacterium symbiont of Taylorina sp.]